MAAEDPGNPRLAQALQEVSERTQTLIREEIELAKAEVQVKVKSLVRGAIIGAVAGIFVLGALVLLLNAAGWIWWGTLFDDADGGGDIWAGFGLSALILLIFAAIAGFIASRLFKKGSPPTPQMAIDEGKRIKETVDTARRSS